ncbi:MAG: T9SS type A sorting domain-containing protein [Bacteroidota bacterium]|nr:T9SS type A sorting domain-containing protein [Bacteroidota bacterium]
MKKRHLLTLLLISLSFKIFAAIAFVTPSGAGTMDGTSWNNAYPGASLQVAINASGSGDEVWVAAGTYYTTSDTNRAVSFSMKNDVTIYGSFAGAETSLSQRILTNGLTSILSAEIGVAGNADNSYHTIHNTGLNNTAVIDGFIISDANDNRTATINEGLGGGIYNDGSGAANVCSPVIRTCAVINNQAVFGAGIFNSGYLGGTANPVIINCVIAFNTAITGGGGIDNFGVSGNANPVITNCIIYNNTAAQRAGGMYCWGGNNGNANPVVLNSVFANNTCVDGGGVVCDNLNTTSGNSGSANPDFRNCIFWGNTASGTGPQFYVLGSGLFTATYSDIDLTAQSAPHIISGAGTGNMNYYPQFTNGNNGAGTDGIWMTADDGLQLNNLSPCVDYGDNSGVTPTDLLSHTRIFNFVVDMGPYELGATFTSIADQNNSGSLISNPYPNPASATTQIGYKLPEGIDEGEIVLYDVCGNEVMRFAVNNSTGTLLISTSAISAGTYYYQLQTATQTSEGKKLIVTD